MYYTMADSRLLRLCLAGCASNGNYQQMECATEACMNRKTKYYKRAYPGPVGYHRWRGETKWALGSTICDILRLWYVSKAVQANDNNLLTLVASYIKLPGCPFAWKSSVYTQPHPAPSPKCIIFGFTPWLIYATIGLDFTVR